MKKLNQWLMVLLVAVAIKQGIFLAVIPAWQVPDEPAHVAYVQALVEQRRLPVFSDHGMDISREMHESLTAIENANPARLGRHYPPGFLSSPTGSDRLLTNNGAPVRNLAARNSPLYYLYEAVPYSLSYGASIETRLLFMRIASSLLLLVTVWLAVKIAQTISIDPWFALTVGLVVGFHPAASLLFTGVNPDAALTVLATGALWTMLRLVTPAQAWRRGLGIALLVGAAASTKSPGWFLVVPAAIWFMAQYKIIPHPMWLKLGLAGLGIIGVLGGGWLVAQQHLSSSDIINFYGAVRPPLTWQRILNNDLFERPVIVWRTFWGHIGWSGVSRYSQPWAYSLMLWLTIVAAGGLFAASWRRRGRWPLNIWLMIASAATLEVFYQIMYWRAGLVSGASHFPIHGRYYLPLIVPIALFLVAGLSNILPRRLYWVGYVVMGITIITVTTVIGGRAWDLYAAERAVGW